MHQPSLSISRVSHDSSSSILNGLERDELDVGVVCPPKRISSRLKVTHRFQDAFTLIANRDKFEEANLGLTEQKVVGKWLNQQPWLVIDEKTETGNRLKLWMRSQRFERKVLMELDNFDLLISLVSLGLGVSIVPQRSLALYGKKRSLLRIPWQKRFSRELVVLTRKQKNLPEHIERFIQNILF